ncbi:MAG TPA: Nramp family divalent metal transporter [Verrucomicrobiae bacterium]|jgi:manganese transport protein
MNSAIRTDSANAPDGTPPETADLQALALVKPVVPLPPSAEAGKASKQVPETPSLPEVNRSIPVPKGLGFWRKMLAFSGPGYLVAVGYMDPGNWATDLEGGSKFGYTLLSVILISNLMAILLQSLCARLGIVTGRDLAQACRDHYSRPVSFGLWILCETAICACDLAEVIGSAIALNLLFKIPLVWGVCITALDVLAVMYLQNKGFRYIEALVVTLILTVGGCFFAEIIFSRPDVVAVLGGFVPKFEVVYNQDMLYIAIGILGATVMPHNLYLHSSIVQTRKYEQTPAGKREAIKFATIDSTVALMFALFINAAILIVSAATFHGTTQEVAAIQDAHKLLSPMLGVTLASTLFAVALLASGQNSTLTGTLAGQIVMEGFLNIRLRPWLRRLITRLIAIVPAVIVASIYGAEGTGKLLVFSQVILSLQLSFAVIPLVLFTSNRRKMGEFTSPLWLKILAWIATGFIVGLNVKYLSDQAGITAWIGKLMT